MKLTKLLNKVSWIEHLKFTFVDPMELILSFTIVFEKEYRQNFDVAYITVLVKI